METILVKPEWLLFEVRNSTFQEQNAWIRCRTRWNPMLNHLGFAQLDIPVPLKAFQLCLFSLWVVGDNAEVFSIYRTGIYEWWKSHSEDI